VNITGFREASLAVFYLAAITTASQAGDSIRDSSQTSVVQKRSNMRFTARVHSMGLFGFAGLIANDNPSVDVSFVYDRRHWGALILKAVDVYDIHSPYDFTLGLFYTSIRLGDKLTVTPYGGFVLEQTHHIAGEGSDLMGIVTTTYKFDKRFALEHTGRFSNLMMEREQFDWLNRFRVSYSGEHVDVMLTCWHNNGIFDRSQYTTVGLNAAYSRIKLSKQVTVSTGITAHLVVGGSDLEEIDRRNGLLLTIATTVD
jgi:hypothetical protein